MKAPTTNSSPRELVPEGNHVARLYDILYIGTIETPYLNEDGTKKEQYKVRLTFELPNEMRTFGEEEKPMVISKEVAFSMYKGSQTAVLRTIVNALVGTPLKDDEAENFDLDDALGMACMVEVAHDTYEGNEYAKAVVFSSIPKGMEVPKQINNSRTMSVHDMKKEDLEKLPEFIAKKVAVSKEWKARFDSEEIERKKNLQAEIDARKPQSADSEEIGPEDIPF